MSEIALSKIVETCQGKLFGAYSDQNIVKDILIDSRRLVSPFHRLFIAIKTNKNDGHKYIHELYEKGVRQFLVEDLPERSSMPEAVFVEVKDSIKSLQKIASFYRSLFSFPVIGITGSNGKTIIKEWLYHLLQPDYNIIRSPKSYNSQIGVPLSVWQMNDRYELGIFEAGISEPGEMKNLARIVQPDIGVFTNIGTAHDKNFINHTQKAGEKLELFKQAKVLIYCNDYTSIQAVIIRSEIHHKVDLFTWSRTQAADLQITKVENIDNKSEINAVYKNQELKICIPFTDDASIENAIHCWAVLLYLNIDNEQISERMKLLHSVAMRLELKKGINNCTIINDSYNSDFNSLSIALDFMDQQHQRGGKTVILSDILQSSQNDSTLYREVAELLEKKNIHRFIGIGNHLPSYASEFKMESRFFKSTDEFLKNYPTSDFLNETILLKGARTFEFEKISKVMQKKAHKTVLETDLNALVHNLNYYRSIVRPNTKIMAMVKAFSYGSGAAEIANILEYHHIDYLAVAYADEGVRLRQAGINTPIMVMNPESQSFDSIIKHHLEPEIYNFRIFDSLEKAINKNILPINKPVKIHIKIETGMNRLGFQYDEIPLLIQKIKENPLIRVESVFSHLAASDSKDYDNFTKEQITIFNEASKKIEASFNYKILKHILNSAGISRFPHAHFDMVRLGISLYGITSDSKIQNQLKKVSTLRTTITQIKKIKKGESVGYNRNYFPTKDIRIGTIPIGYADGIDRRLGNGHFEVLINGKRHPIVGNVCMDMCMIELMDDEIKEGDSVIIFGKELPVEEIAQKLNTISYEVLTGISSRVKRIYYHN